MATQNEDLQNPGEVVQADPDIIDDGDSAIGIGSSPDSTVSLIVDDSHFIDENGRTYHGFKAGKYFLPNDERERSRLDLQHQLFLSTFDKKLALCPIPRKLDRVLDVGTGTGIWAIEFAVMYPEAEVIGVDLSPIQPRLVPPNLRFQIDDSEDEWTFRNRFDYIHARMMNASFRDWPKFFSQCFDYLEPGGYLEMQDCAVFMKVDDDSWPAISPLRRMNEKVLESRSIIGLASDIAERYQELMRDAGFENVTEIVDRWPMNPWPTDERYQELGRLNQTNLEDGLEASTAAMFTRALGWSREAVVVYLSDVRRELKNTDIHTYVPVYVVYGQKPAAANA